MPKKLVSRKRKTEYQQEEIIDLICEFAKSGKSQSEIGMILRDQYGIPDVKEATGKSISQTLKEKGLLNSWPEDLISLFKKAVRVAKHLEKNKKDVRNRRNLRIIESKIKRLVRYYKGVGRIPDDWYYDIEKIKMIVKE
ncbi:MAG: 30S ribosomal protein S15 [archaeon]